MRPLVLLFSILLLIGAGCSDPSQTVFVLNDRTQSLIPAAREPIEADLSRNFGSPNHLVAWLELPVHFGQREAVVADSGGIPDEQRSFRFKIRFPDADTQDTTLDASALPGLGLLWLSGQYRSASGDDTGLAMATIGISVADYDAESQILTLAQKMDPPPEPGDRFMLVGQIFRQGSLLYRRHCIHCHGVSGDGNGPTAQYLNPHPHDYRLGVFKFTSTKTREKATRDDLIRRVQHGVPGTYMPAFFSALNKEEIAAVVEYVRWLAIRGELEDKLASLLETDYSQSAYVDRTKSETPEFVLDELDQYFRTSYPSESNSELRVIVDAWLRAEDGSTVIRPSRGRFETRESLVEWFEENSNTLDELLDWYEQNKNAVALPAFKSADYPERLLRLIRMGADMRKLIHAAKDSPETLRNQLDTESEANGQRLFQGETVKCYTCHGKTGRGDGPQTKEFQKVPGENRMYPERGLHDDWGNLIKPLDLTRGIYRGGRRPIDIYRRIHAGIKGTPMASFATTLTDDDDIWDLVNYVLKKGGQVHLFGSRTPTGGWSQATRKD